MTRSAEEVRGYLAGQVNQATRRLGMFSDETSLLLLFRALAFTDGLEDQWDAEHESLRKRGAFLSTGVHGAFQYVLPDVGRGDAAIASVYAEFAHRVGWLALDRTLTGPEYDTLRALILGWVTADRTMSDVTATFGPPSLLLGGTNLRYPKTLLYATARQKPIVCFHLWNKLTGVEAQAVHDEPVPLAVRTGGEPFTSSLIFTPEGIRRRPTASSRFESSADPVQHGNPPLPATTPHSW